MANTSNKFAEKQYTSTNQPAVRRSQTNKTLPNALLPELFSLWENGMTQAKIVVWLQENKGIKASTTCVAKNLRKMREEKRNLAIQAMKDEMAKHSNKDLERLSELTFLLHNKAIECIAKGDLQNAKGLSDTVMKFYSKKFEILGIESEEETTDEEEDEMRAKLGLPVAERTN
jgi:hypothetical protein